VKTKHLLHKFKPGRYAYRGFNIRTRELHWEILDANSETTSVKSLIAGIRLVDSWHEKGQVE
jgi:hypothetical protein